MNQILERHFLMPFFSRMLFEKRFSKSSFLNWDIFFFFYKIIKFHYLILAGLLKNLVLGFDLIEF